MKQLEIDRFWRQETSLGELRPSRTIWKKSHWRVRVGPSRESRLVQDGRLHVVTSTNDSAALRDPRRV
jgi:hypothetical protein